MLEHVSYHKDWAKIIKSEIDNDYSDWFCPKGKVGGGEGPGDFDYGQMRFVNRNLNYFYFENMISLALKNEYEYNPCYSMTLNFCNSLRPILNEFGPFGRMCIWKIPVNGYLLPHVDNWDYHRQIRRFIFCVSDHEAHEAMIKISNQNIEVKEGLLFSFNPWYEKHEFVNNSNKDWYFLGFDYWGIDKLRICSSKRNITKDTPIFYEDKFGGNRSKAKFMSKE